MRRRIKKNKEQKIKIGESLFKTEKLIGALQFFVPEKINGKIVFKPPVEAMEEGIVKWLPSLVG